MTRLNRVHVDLATASGDYRVDHHRPPRAEAVDAADALLEVHRVPRDVQVNQAPGPLHVEPLTPGARRHEEAGAVVTLEAGHLGEAFVVGLVADDDRRSHAVVPLEE
jgi:hypothetical protein